MEAVMMKSGEQPRYFNFGTDAVHVISATTSNTAGSISQPLLKESPYSTFLVGMIGTATCAATVLIQGTNDPLTAAGTQSWWYPIATVTCTSSGTSAANGAVDPNPWRWVRASVTALTAGGKLQVIMGV